MKEKLCKLVGPANSSIPDCANVPQTIIVVLGPIHTERL